MSSLIVQSVKNLPACNAGELGLIPGSGRSSGERNGNSLRYCRLENPMDKPGRLQSMGSQESDMTEQLTHHHHVSVPKTVFITSSFMKLNIII